MKKFVKSISMILLSCALMLPTTVFAESFDLADCTVTTENSNGITPRIGLNESYIKNGYYNNYYTSDGDYFYITKGETVTFRVNLEKAHHVQMGYATSKSNRIMTYDGTSKNPTTSISIPANGDYFFWILNVSSDTMHILGGSIEY